MLPPVVENGLFLGHLSLGVLHIVMVEDGKGDGQGGGDDQEGHQHRADVCGDYTNKVYSISSELIFIYDFGFCSV